MKIVTIILSVFLSLFSTAVMSYVALATPIGPWIAPTLVFIVFLLSKLVTTIAMADIAYAVCAGSIGGIVATACAFSFPTLYFLDPGLFNAWMQSPLFFCGVLGGLAFLAGVVGLLVADWSEKTLIDSQGLSFPIGQLIEKMIVAQNQIRKAYELMAGFCITAVFCFLQGGLFFARAIVPKTIILMKKMHYSWCTFPAVSIQLGMTPMVCAIGFVTGHVIALPLAVGAVSSIFFLGPIQALFFAQVTMMEFTLAFCSGIVLFITTMSLVGMPKQIIKGVKKWINSVRFLRQAQDERGSWFFTPFVVSLSNHTNSFFSAQSIGFLLMLIAALFLFFSYFNFPYLAQLYLIACAIITTYQISAIAGRIGLALLGRFATFVMVPAMFIFNLNYVHLVFIATFIEISGGVAADILFGRKLAQLAGISRSIMRRYQIMGLLVSCISIGIVFWFLINHFGLGSPELFAYRAQSRQLLIQAQQFDYMVMVIGALFGLFLKQINLNPMLVLGGLLMPLDITIGLVFGGLLAWLSRDKEDWYPFWSGVFASNSICMLLRSIFV